MSCKPIMVVEDDESIKAKLVQALQIEDFEVLVASNGAEAIEVLEQCPRDRIPRCIILDLMMPVMDGYTFMKRLREKHPHWLSKIKIIVATARGSPGFHETLPFAVQRIQKPFHLEELYSALGQHCG